MSDETNALADGLRVIPVPTTYDEWMEAVDRSYEADAAAILAALNAAGWALYRISDVSRMREAAISLGYRADAAADCYYGGFQKGCDHRPQVSEAIAELRAAIVGDAA